MNFTISEYPALQFGSIYCIGRNYAKHIKEMKSTRTKNPVVFLKPRSSLIFNQQTVHLPSNSNDVHHEVEMVLLIGNKTKNISVQDAALSIKAVAVGLDITARDLQESAKKNGLPWSLAKGFDTFAPVGNFVEYNKEMNLENMHIELHVNGEIRQSGNTSNMLFKPSEIISYLSNQFTLYPGDLVFTGTPEGVGPIKPGDVLKADIHHSLSSLEVHVQSNR